VSLSRSARSAASSSAAAAAAAAAAPAPPALAAWLVGVRAMTEGALTVPAAATAGGCGVALALKRAADVAWALLAVLADAAGGADAVVPFDSPSGFPFLSFALKKESMRACDGVAETDVVALACICIGRLCASTGAWGHSNAKRARQPVDDTPMPIGRSTHARTHTHTHAHMSTRATCTCHMHTRAHRHIPAQAMSTWHASPSASAAGRSERPCLARARPLRTVGPGRSRPWREEALQHATLHRAQVQHSPLG
jgi:hypothetical protein